MDWARADRIDPCASMAQEPYVPRDLAAAMAEASDDGNDEEALRWITSKTRAREEKARKKSAKESVKGKPKVVREARVARGAASGSASAEPPSQAVPPPSAHLSSPPPRASSTEAARWSREGGGVLRSADLAVGSRKRSSMDARAEEDSISKEQRRAAREARARAPPPEAAIPEDEDEGEGGVDEQEEEEGCGDDQEPEEGDLPAEEAGEEEEDEPAGKAADAAAHQYEEDLRGEGASVDDPKPRENDGRPPPRAGIRRVR